MQIQLNDNCVISFSSIGDGNMAYHIPLESNDVENNRLNFASKIGLNLHNIAFMNQTHSNKVQIASLKKFQNCDGLVSNDKNIALAVMVADCIPMFMYDKVNHVIAAVHAGRVGTFNNIAQESIEKMTKNYKSKVENIEVYMGPSIHKCCYEVSSEIVTIVKKSYTDEFVTNRNIDLQGINKKLLKDIGVLERSIHISDICTKCNGEHFYSYRVHKDKSGRFIGVIHLV